MNDFNFAVHFVAHPISSVKILFFEKKLCEEKMSAGHKETETLKWSLVSLKYMEFQNFCNNSFQTIWKIFY
jgi:hypothetical protein